MMMTPTTDSDLRMVTLMNDVDCYVRANYAELSAAAMRAAEMWTVPNVRSRLEAERRNGYFDGKEPPPGWEKEWATRRAAAPLTDLEIRKRCGPLKCAGYMFSHLENEFGRARHYFAGHGSLGSMTTDEAALILILTWCFHDEHANEKLPVAIAVQGLPWDDSDLDAYFEATGTFYADIECRDWGMDRIYHYQWPRVVQAALDRSMTKLQPEIRAAQRGGRIIADARERSLLILLLTGSTAESRTCSTAVIAGAFDCSYGAARGWLKKCADQGEVAMTRGAGSGAYLTAKGVTAANKLVVERELALDESLLHRLNVYNRQGLLELRAARLAENAKCSD